MGNTDIAPNDWTAFVARVTPNGSLDTTFDTDGIRIEPLPAGFDSANAVTIGADGKIVVVGRGNSDNIDGGSSDFVIARYNQDGSRDAMFDGDGLVFAVEITGASDVAIQPDGKIVVTGGREHYFATLRLNPNGSFDTSFSTDGLVFTNINNGAGGVAIALQPDGKIVTAGWTQTATGPDFMLVRYLGDVYTVSGTVFDDRNNNGVNEPGNGEAGLQGVTVTLAGTDNRGPVNRSTLTGPDGSYSFDDVFVGTYTLTEDQPTDFLDGKETAGTLGGTVDNSQDSNTISAIVIGNDGVNATGYNFAEIRPSDLQGLVWEDFNNDGEVNFGEKAIENVSIALTGTDDRGNAVNLTTQTDVDGVYMFFDLRPGTYTLTETQPVGFLDGMDIVGFVPHPGFSGDNSANDVISGIVIGRPGSVAENYNFGERPPAGGGVTGGQTATIGFWQNNNGQALIESLNGGANSTRLAEWLAATFGNMYGTACFNSQADI